MKREPFINNRLFCPGPTPVPDRVKHAALDTSLYHRSDDFYALFLDCCNKLKPIFGSDTLPLILAASGTGAMEAAMVNLTAAGDEVVVLNAGKFGERWEKLAKAYGCNVEVVRSPAGEAPGSDEAVAALKKLKSPRAIFMQANETSTGVRLPYEDIAQTVRSAFPHCLIVVDAISSLCAHPMKMEKMGIDCVVAGSQKGFGMAPGLAFIALSSRAWKSISKRERFYFDLERERKGQEKGRSAWTSPISLVQNLSEALLLIHEAGIDAVLAQHARHGAAARAAVHAMGLKLFPKGHYSDALTTVAVPQGLDGQALQNHLKSRYGAVFAGGQDELKGKILRFAHLGFVSRFDLLDGIAALEFSLKDLGWRFETGSGVGAAMRSL